MTKDKLSQEEFNFLSKNFALQKKEQRNKTTTILSKDLLDEKVCLEILQYLTKLLNSPSLKITASLLSKRIAYLCTASCLYTMSIYDKGLDLCLDNCYFDFNHENGLWTSKMILKDLNSSFCINKKRAEFREKLIKALFAHHLSLIWENFSKITKISKKILWENTAVRVYSLYEKKIDKEVFESHKKNIQEDFDFLISTNKIELFGEKYNPLKVFYTHKIPRVRKTCCFYYKTKKKKEYCNICPLLKNR